ncbi:translation initiation factor [Salibacter halophilus]|uniref:Translation initiation factor n=1 Tax=Salibacter halophilus TaxID=1803916 RepID=A0A6N6M6T9_9FLAO|nr:translation initiation factor [Salibacter halophilus]KAB1064313.1 translation initiation factor [Salibacter halophilus]
MSKKNKKKRVDVVYSTNPDYEYDYEDDGVEETLPPEEQNLKVRIEKKGRGGKTAVVVKGFIGSEDDLKDLAKTIKTKCGTGGSAKDGEIIIQGEMRNKVLEVLQKEGYNAKQAGG